MRRAGNVKTATTEGTEERREKSQRQIGGRSKSDRALQWHGRLRGQGHCVSHVEVWVSGERLRISEIFSLSQPSSVLDFSRAQGEPDHPHFGDVAEIYNVIDARQSEAQNTVIEALRGLGYNEASGPLHAFLLRDGRAHSALCGRTGLSAFGRRKGAVVYRGFGTQRLWSEGRRSARYADRFGAKEVDSRHPELND